MVSSRPCPPFPSLSPSITYCLLLVLSLYVVLDLSSHHSTFPSLLCRSPFPSTAQSSLGLHQTEELQGLQRICLTREGHLESSENGSRRVPGADPWRQMKWVGEAALCRVKGHLIEKLDVDNNFRRGFALKFATDVEDKTHVLPWLLASRVDLNLRKRRVYLDLGANEFSTSIYWFLRMYPCDFTEVHAFEASSNLLRKPTEGFDEDSNYAAPNQWALALKRTPEVPQWMLDRIKIYYKFVADKDDEPSSSINITRFIKQELKLKPTDTVVVKMDIEGSEWPVLRRWMDDPEMPQIVDELFVEVHYDHPSMRGYHWARFAPTTREDARKLFADLRWHGFFAHPWP